MLITDKQRTSLDLHKIKRKMDAHSLSTNVVLNLQLRTFQITLVLHLLLTTKCVYESLLVLRESLWSCRTHIYIAPLQKTSCYPKCCQRNNDRLIRLGQNVHSELINNT
jgi:hypothetical protein